jgi:hypothetical protein
VRSKTNEAKQKKLRSKNERGSKEQRKVFSKKLQLFDESKVFFLINLNGTFSKA